MARDDFEANKVGRPPAGWTISINPGTAGTVAIDDTRAFSGTLSVHVATPAGGRGQTFITRALAALPGNTFFGRMMIWVSATPKDVHWDNIRGSGSLPGTTRQAWYNYGGGGTGAMLANYYTNGSDCWKTSTTMLPVGRWTCVEWRFDGAHNAMGYWLDGQPVSDLSVATHGDGCAGTNLWQAPRFDRLSLGWYNAQTSSIPIDMWIDDVAIGATRIACDWTRSMAGRPGR